MSDYFKDALGNAVEIGQVYGYSNRANGIVSVIVGKVTHFTTTKVGMIILKRGKSVYGQDVEFEESRIGSKVSTISNTLFKLGEDY